MIYADYNGSSPLLPTVKDYLQRRLDTDLFANPNAIHSFGQKIYKGLERSREIIAGVFNCHTDQVIFNSGSSEGITHVFHSILNKVNGEKNIIIASPIEHAVVTSALSYYENNKNFSIKYVEVDPNGTVKITSLLNLLKENKNRVALVTIMAANNETGVLQPFVDVAEICQKYDVEFFCDTTQLFGKAEFDFEKSGLNYAVCSGHKLGSLPGVGCLITKCPSQLSPLIFGSSQEMGLRGGTQNYLGIETLALAISTFEKNTNCLADLKKAKLNFESEVKKLFPESVIFGEKAERLSGTTLIGYPGVHGQAVQIELESCDIFVTTSSACTDNQPETSKILKVMGVQDQIGRGVVRISLSYLQGETEYKKIAEALKKAYNKLNKIKAY